MAFDRRITVRIESEATLNQFNEPIPGPVTDYPRWAEQRSAGSVDQATGGGVVIVASRSFTVRDFVELRNAPINFVSVVDEDGQAWDAENIVLSDARRRFIIIETTRTS